MNRNYIHPYIKNGYHRMTQTFFWTFFFPHILFISEDIISLLPKMTCASGTSKGPGEAHEKKHANLDWLNFNSCH